MAVFTPTDRPKSVRNRCLIELFVALFVLSLCPFDISVGVGAFVIGLGQISSFLPCVKRTFHVRLKTHVLRMFHILVKVYGLVHFLITRNNKYYNKSQIL